MKLSDLVPGLIGAARGAGLRCLALGACLPLSGCPNPNLYQTARTVPQGEVSGSAAAELFVVRAVHRERLASTGIETRETPTKAHAALPSLMLRLGVGERTDIGFHVYNGGVPGMDFKHLLIRGDIDLAIAPGGHLHNIPGNEVTNRGSFFQLPLILDFNLSPAFSVVLSPGVAHASSDQESVTNSNALDGATSYAGGMTRLGLGLNLRGSAGFAVHPEATWLHGVSRDEAWDQLLVGLGFTFGALPTFRD